MSAEIHQTAVSSLPEKIARFSFLALIFSTALMQPFVYSAGQRLSPTDFIFPFAAAFLLISIIIKQNRFRWHNFYWILLFYFAALVLSAVYSLDPAQSFLKLVGEIYLFGLAIVTFNLVRTEFELVQTIKYWLAGTCAAVLIGVFSLLLFYLQPENALLNYTTYHYGSVPVGNYPRLSSTFVSASMFCNYLNVSFVFILAALQTKMLDKILLLPLLALVSICAIFTISAGLGGFALAAGLFLWLFFRDRRKRWAFSFLIGGIIASLSFLLINFFALQNHSASIISFKIPLLNMELQPSARLLIWQESLITFRRNFFTGVGLGQDVCRVVFQNTDGTTSVLTDAHNYLLNAGAQNGIFALLAISALTWFIIVLGLPLRLTKSGNRVILTFLTIAFICSFFYQGLTGSFEEARHLWILMGMILSAHQINANVSAEEQIN